MTPQYLNEVNSIFVALTLVLAFIGGVLTGKR
jgi:hypothetical protein